jgi:hypothetical protein
VVGSYAPTALSARARSSGSGAETTDGMHAAWMAVDDMKIATSLTTRITDCSLSLVNRGDKNKGSGVQGIHAWR